MTRNYSRRLAALATAGVAAILLGSTLRAEPPATAARAAIAPAPAAKNLIPNGDFRLGPLGGLPDGWQLKSARPGSAPAIRLVEDAGRPVLLASGNGNTDCVGYVTTRAPITLGKTYRFRVLCHFSDDINPQENLLFQAIGPDAFNGIGRFKRLAAHRAEGEATITYPAESDGKKPDAAAQAEIRIYFRLSAVGKAWIEHIELCETAPLPPRWVRVACTGGNTNLNSAAAVLAEAGRAKADLVLLPEYMQGGLIPEPIDGPSAKLMAAMARKHRMYVAGGIVRAADKEDRLYNTVLIFDRQGKLLGKYDKHHPYSPELNWQGITPGTDVPVFDADFGRIGVMTCYDSWFTDVAELLGLKGAEVVLFPNAGYYHSLMPARAADNGLRIVTSSTGCGYGVWDTAGRSVLHPDADRTVYTNTSPPTFKDVSEKKIGNVGLLMVSLDLSVSPAPHYNGGTMLSSPGGRRNRAEQKSGLEDEIKRERQRWWSE